MDITPKIAGVVLFDGLRLPHHLMVEMLTHLDIVTQARARRVCKEWNDFVKTSAGVRETVMIPGTNDLRKLFFIAAGSGNFVQAETKTLIISTHTGAPQRALNAWLMVKLKNLYGGDGESSALGQSHKILDAVTFRAEKLRTIIVECSQEPCWKLNDFPYSLPESVRKIILLNVKLVAYVDITPIMHGIFPKVVMTKSIDGVWPWLSDDRMGAVETLGNLLGPLDDVKLKMLEDMVAFSDDLGRKAILFLLQFSQAYARTGDLDKKESFDANVDLSTLSGYPAWIQQMVFLTVQHIFPNRLEGLVHRRS